MSVLRNLLVLSLTLFVLIGCGNNTDPVLQKEEPKKSGHLEAEKPDKSGTERDQSDAVEKQKQKENKESSKTEVAKTNTESEKDSPEVVNQDEIPEVVENVNEEIDSPEAVRWKNGFVVVNNLPVVVAVSKIDITNPFASILPWVEAEYEVIQKVSLGTGDCVEILSKDAGKVQIQSYTSDSDEDMNVVCARGECEAEDSELTHSTTYEPQQMPLQSLPEKECEDL